jgi:hypothetical protein
VTPTAPPPEEEKKKKGTYTEVYDADGKPPPTPKNGRTEVNAPKKTKPSP